MKKLLFILLCVCTFPGLASHIVGGEFELIHQPGSNNLFRVNLIVYFDEKFGSQDAKDDDVTASIFRKRDNVLMQSVRFHNYTTDPVLYTQPACSIDELKTSKLTYTTTITLPADVYDDPDGYYIIWERCCRNYDIKNIISKDPAVGLAAGQTFYLEFPPVVKNGKPFINSSPRLFPPLSDYACPQKRYYADFAGVDDDGDLLVYSLVTPLSTHSAEALPAVASAPYPLVQWASPFSATNILNGNPDLKITPDGFLTATVPMAGLYVFAVKCEEFRDGVKIGEVRRDFQMKVVDRCADGNAPEIKGKKISETAFTHNNVMNVTFASGINNVDRCIQVQVSDDDSKRAVDLFEEKIIIKAISLDFKKDITGILPSITNAILSNGSTQSFDICFNECPYKEGSFQIGIVAYDDACSQPLTDTLKITVNIVPPLNLKPYFTTADVKETFQEDEDKTWQILGFDDDGIGNILVDNVITDGFELGDFGLDFTLDNRTDKTYEAKLTWNTHCNTFDFSQRTSFAVKVVLNDTDKCLFHKYDTMTFNLNVTRPGADPIIDSDLTADLQERNVNVTKKIFETLSFQVSGKQADNHFLVLDGDGNDFNFPDYGMTFPTATGSGLVNSPFQWNIDCSKVNLADKDIFDLQFIVVDSRSKCKIYKADTLDVHVTVEPPNSIKPVLHVSSADLKNPLIDNGLSIDLGQQIALNLSGKDFNHPQAPLVIQLLDASGNVPPEGYEFATVNGTGQAQATFLWQPDCAIFKSGVYTNDYIFMFCVNNKHCRDVKGDTAIINLTIHDIESQVADFIPPNVVTPNGDAENEFFAMMMLDKNDAADGDVLVSILPKDNCTSRFVNVSIYNRWGREIFSSTNRDFKWYPKGEAAGVYFYYLHFSDKVYKGSVSVRY